MAVIVPGGTLVATGAGAPAVYAGPSPSGLWLTSLSPNFVNNSGGTNFNPPPGTGTAPGGAGMAPNNAGGKCSPGCASGNCGS